MVDINKLKKHFDASSATDLKYMSYSSEAMLQQSPGLSRLMLWFLVFIVVVLVIWACLAEVDEFTRGIGKVVPSSAIQVVQNLEGGILEDLMVDEGDVVERGQPLMQIDDTLLASTYRENQIRIAHLQAKAARLRAEAERTSFEEELLRYPMDYEKEVLERERELYESRLREFNSRTNALQQRVRQKEQELASARSHKRNLEESYELLNRELTFTRPLVQDGAVSRVELLRLEREVNDLQGELEQARSSIPRLESALEEARDNVDSYIETFTSESRAELNETISELVRLQETNRAYADRVRRTVVRSPVRGTIKQLKVKTEGGVIQPGMDLVEIVPIEDSLVLDVRIQPAEIAFIHPGQEATVKFTAYDYSVHGGLPGRVTHISPDTIVDEEGNSYYQVRLVTDGSDLGKGSRPLPIIPGMTVEVDILTGQKTIMDFILKPILKTKELALKER